MSADELRQAAETLRARADAAVGQLNDWSGDEIVMWACDGSWITESDGQIADYFTLVNPRIGLALADWLKHSLRQLGGLVPSDSHPALVVARLINGGAA